MLFQDPASPVMEGIIEFHHDLMFIITFIVFFVLFMICAILFNFVGRPNTARIDRSIHNTTLEIA